MKYYPTLLRNLQLFIRPICTIVKPFVHRLSPIFVFVRKRVLFELGRLSVNDFKAVQKLPFVVVLNNVRSMHNVGSMIRTCDAFLCHKMVLCGITGTPPHREITKTAIGAENSVQWEYQASTVDAIVKLKELNYHIVAIEQTDESKLLQHTSFSHQNIAFVFGNEIDGIEDAVLALCDESVEIPQLGTKHSFNVAVSCGMVLWEFARKRFELAQ